MKLSFRTLTIHCAPVPTINLTGAVKSQIKAKNLVNLFSEV